MTKAKAGGTQAQPTKARRTRSHKTYIHKLLKDSPHNAFGFSKKGMEVMNSFACDMYKTLSEQAGEMASIKGAKTISHLDVTFATRMVLKGAGHKVGDDKSLDGMAGGEKSSSLATYAHKEGVRAIKQYTGISKPTKMSSGKGKALRAGLIFSVARARKALKQHGRQGCAQHVGDRAAVYLAAVVQFLCAEALQCAVTNARLKKKSRIEPRHITMGFEADDELKSLYNRMGMIVQRGGVAPNIHRVLLPKTGQKKHAVTDAAKMAKSAAKAAERARQAAMHAAV